MPSVSDVKYLVVTADQVRSRQSGDRVPQALDLLGALPSRSRHARAFARTAGDEIQALFDRSDEAVVAVETLIREGDWRIGVGVGAVDEPLPDDVRAANGPAFVAAREAVNRARNAPQQLAVVAGGGPAGLSRERSDGADGTLADEAQAALELLALQWRRRTDAGWQVAELLDAGLPQHEVASKLGISASAVSQRVRTAAVEEVARGVALAVACLERARA